MSDPKKADQAEKPEAATSTAAQRFAAAAIGAAVAEMSTLPIDIAKASAADVFDGSSGMPYGYLGSVRCSLSTAESDLSTYRV
eukprot:990796-Pleurochrysis_carterae.AAC.1